MKYSPYSFSKISTYKQCARKFKFKYIQKIKEPITDMTPLLKGTCVHSMLEKYPAESTNSLVPKYRNIFEDFLETKYKALLDIEHFSETAIGFDDKLSPVSYDNGTIFRGYIDYYAYVDGGMVVADWKTGKYKDIKYQDFNQLLFYALYLFYKNPNVDKIKAMFIYVEHNLDNSIIFERKYIDEYKKELIHIIRDIEKDEIFEKKTQKLCDWCGYRDRCFDNS